MNVLIMGAAGRDFHNFNCCYRENPSYRVVAFTATQIPDIEGRTYPAALAGKHYPEGIPIYPEDELENLIAKLKVELVIFAYSDVPHTHVMHMASRVNAAGANFGLIGAEKTMLPSKKPVVAVCAVRTGCGKSQTTRKVAEVLKAMGKKVAVCRHPMPYGDIAKQACQRFGELADMDRHECTIEEREEYELHIQNGNLLFAGVDYHRILAEAEKEADVVLWDGGNNDMPFFRPDLMFTVADPHRSGHETAYHPGETNFRMGHVILINKVNTAEEENIRSIEENAKRMNPKAEVVRADSAVHCHAPEKIKGKAVLVVEDGPTLTHGDMTFGAAHVAAREHGASSIVQPRPYAVGTLKATYEKYPHMTEILPAMGYGDSQIADLEATINATPCDAVAIGTPIDLAKLVKINKPAVRVSYDLAGPGADRVEEILRIHPRLA